MKEAIIINPQFIDRNKLTLREGFWLATLFAYANEASTIYLPNRDKYYLYSYQDIIDKLPYTFKSKDTCRKQMRNFEKKGYVILRDNLGINKNIRGFKFTKKSEQWTL